MASRTSPQVPPASLGLPGLRPPGDPRTSPFVVEAWVLHSELAIQRIKKLQYHLPQCTADARSPAPLHTLLGPSWLQSLLAPALIGSPQGLSPVCRSRQQQPCRAQTGQAHCQKSRYLADLRRLIGLTRTLLLAIPANYNGPQRSLINPPTSPASSFVPPRDPCRSYNPQTPGARARHQPIIGRCSLDVITKTSPERVSPV